MSLKSMAQEIITVEDPMAEEGQVETPFFEIQEDEMIHLHYGKDERDYYCTLYISEK